jgi:hypothetical protein
VPWLYADIYTHAQRNLVSTEICAYAHTHFGVEDGIVLFHVHIHICTYAHPINTYWLSWSGQADAGQ